MKQLITRLAVAAWAAGSIAGLAAQSAPPPPKPEQKTEAKPAPSVAGKWSVSVDTQQGAMVSSLELKIDGKKVTGTMASQMGESPVTGEFADGKLKFSIAIQTNSGSIDITFNGAFKDDGSLAGSMEYGQGPMAWTATRVKGL